MQTQKAGPQDPSISQKAVPGVGGRGPPASPAVEDVLARGQDRSGCTPGSGPRTGRQPPTLPRLRCSAASTTAAALTARGSGLRSVLTPCTQGLLEPAVLTRAVGAGQRVGPTPAPCASCLGHWKGSVTSSELLATASGLHGLKAQRNTALGGRGGCPEWACIQRN